MYPVSERFHEAMTAPRRHVRARVTIDYSDPFGDPSLEAEASESAHQWLGQVYDGETLVPYRWAAWDGTWRLDDPIPWRLMPGTPEEALLYQVGWWGTQFAGPDGSFAPPYPTLTVTHAPRPARTLRVVGDTARREWPVEFTLSLYGEDGQLLHREVVTGNGGPEWTKDLPRPVQGVVKEELVITRWSHPGRQAKIAECFASIQQTYEDEDLVALHVVEERETSDAIPVGAVASNMATVRLVNDGRFDPDNERSPLYGLLLPNRRIRIWLGAQMGDEVEWVPMGTFWSVQWDSATDAPEATVQALDRLEHLRQRTYRTSVVRPNVSAAELARDILVDAGLSAREFIIEDELERIIIPWAWFPPMTHREALRILAEAAQAIVYCDREGRIRVGAAPVSGPGFGITVFLAPWFPAEVIAEQIGIGPDDYFRWSAPARHDQVANEVIVRAVPLVPDTALSEVYRSTTPITVPAGEAVTVTVEYQDPPVMGAVAQLESPPPGVTISWAEYYAWGADVQIVNSGTSVADVTLVVTGTRLVPRDGVVAVAADPLSQRLYGRKVYEVPANHLVQTLDQAQGVAEMVLTSRKDPRRDLEMEWRGNPAVELGDVVEVITDLTGDRQSHYAVTRQEFEWAGYLRARLSGRRVTVDATEY